jgi:8-oxo-dGTP pyrophosphatase MutT (NUDIX family)
MNDPRLHALREALSAYASDADDPPLPPAGRVQAAVAVVLRRRPTDLDLLLIKRAQHPRDPWSGHMALPGGRREEGDSDLLATALRETEEEVGIALRPDTHLLGALDEVHPASRRLPELVIAPWVAAVGPEVEAVPDPSEVATAVWVPLSHLTDDAALSEVLIDIEGGPLAFPSFRYRDYQIWGLTFRILDQFLALYRGDPVEPPPG